MNIQSLKPAENSRFSQKRLGRGIGSGIGKTSGKGHKGQNARSGGGVRVGFEGGQMPLVRKLPRRGFNNYNFQKQYSIVNLAVLNKFEENLVHEIPFLDYVPKIYISAKTHQRLNQIFKKTNEVYAECTKRVATGLLNKVVNDAYVMNPPQSVKNKRLKILYTTQVGVEPPTFVLFTNNGTLMKDHYKRYIENKLREAFGFFGTSIRISVRERSNKNSK